MDAIRLLGLTDFVDDTSAFEMMVRGASAGLLVETEEGIMEKLKGGGGIHAIKRFREAIGRSS